MNFIIGCGIEEDAPKVRKTIPVDSRINNCIRIFHYNVSKLNIFSIPVFRNEEYL